MADALRITETEPASLETAEQGTSLWKDALHMLK